MSAVPHGHPRRTPGAGVRATNERLLRDALGQFVTGVTVVTTRDATDRVAGVTANSFSAVSLEPPLVLFSLDRSSRSLDVFLAADHCAVNVLSSEQRELSLRFGRRGTDKWEDLHYERGSGGCPVLPRALAVFQCRIRERLEGGDHVIFLMDVLEFEQSDAGSPLVFYRGRYRELGDDNLRPGS